MLLPIVVGVGVAAQPVAASGGGGTRLISSSGTAVFGTTGPGSDTMGNPEIRPQQSDSSSQPFLGQVTDRSLSGPATVLGPGVLAGGRAEANPELLTSFDGLYHRQQRLANHANQFSVEPPDQGLCVGGGFVMEAVNDVTRVFNKSGTPLTAVQDLNTFFGYAPAFVRPGGPFGPFVTDPTCYYDPPTQRWFLVVLTIDTKPANGSFSGPNHLDIAVSQSADPTGSWNIYRIPVQDDGTQGTPGHGCTGTPAGTGIGPCFGDYPHIGADANGFYITTNEYSFFGPEFHGAQIYAFSKKALAAGAATVAVTQFDTNGLAAGNSGFALAPTVSETGRVEPAAGGTEYFLSSNAASEAHGDGTGAAVPSQQILVWALTNTGSLNSGAPALSLSQTAVPVGLYATPPPSEQKVGSTPLKDCLNSDPCSTFLIGQPDPFKPEVEYKLDSSDTRMHQTSWANGKLWGALDTALTVNGVNKAGIEWFIIKPSVASGTVTAVVASQGYLGLANNNLTYPAIGVTHGGRGAIAFTVVGTDYYPSAGYASINEANGVGTIVHLAASGAGPADGFSGYKPFGQPPGTIRPRWGDYGAAVADGSSVWMASEYIGQTCDLATYTSRPFGSCGGTRTALANWDTRITQVSP